MNNQPLSPVNEFLDKIRKKLNSNPLSLSAMAYREILSEGPEMAANESELIRQSFLEGYKQAFEDLKNHNEEKATEPINDGGTQSAEDRLAIKTSDEPERISRNKSSKPTNSKGARVSKTDKQ